MKRVVSILKVLSIVLGYIVIFSPIIILYLFFTFYLFDDMDTCMDIGLCKEGLPLNTEKGQITINKQSCIENEGVWIVERKSCNFRYNEPSR